MLQRTVAEEQPRPFYEIVDLATRHCRTRIVPPAWRARSRAYQTNELSRTLSGERRPCWDQLELVFAHGDAQLIIEHIARIAGLRIETVQRVETMADRQTLREIEELKRKLADIEGGLGRKPPIRRE